MFATGKKFNDAGRYDTCLSLPQELIHYCMVLLQQSNSFMGCRCTKCRTLEVLNQFMLLECVFLELVMPLIYFMCTMQSE